MSLLKLIVTVLPSFSSVTITGVAAPRSAVNSPVILLSAVKMNFILSPPAGMFVMVILKKLARCFSSVLLPLILPAIGGLKLFVSVSIEVYVYAAGRTNVRRSPSLFAGQSTLSGRSGNPHQ